MGSFDLKIFSYVKEWTLTRHFNNYQPLEKDFDRISYLVYVSRVGGYTHKLHSEINQTGRLSKPAWRST
jgi:hypothetical protein